MGPCRDFHLLPASEGTEPELEKPFRLLLFGRNKPDDVFIEPLGNELLLHISHEAMFVFLTGYILKYIFFCPVIHIALTLYPGTGTPPCKSHDVSVPGICKDSNILVTQ